MNVDSISCIELILLVCIELLVLLFSISDKLFNCLICIMWLFINFFFILIVFFMLFLFGNDLDFVIVSIINILKIFVKIYKSFKIKN